jgi:4-hydroxy-2-oxoheptanedioate aldolase
VTIEQFPSAGLAESPIGNRFKAAIKNQNRQIGLWSSLCSNIVAEVIAGAGFSWILIDAEHAPNELSSVLLQLQAMRGGTAEAVVRPAANDPVLIKRLLDIGARSLMIPQVRCADEARSAISATRYPPHGIRGVSVSQRANRFSRDREYFRRINDDLCVLIQIETRPALEAVDEIASIPGVDGLFVGPSDLAAELGHFGDAGHPDVQEAFGRVLAAAARAGKPAGILAPVESDADYYLSRGYSFVAVGSDLGLLVRGCDALLNRFA